MADEGLFGLDGTQPLPADPLLPDPLGGLVTGSTFTYVDSQDYVPQPPVPLVAPPPPVQARRRPTAGVKRPAARSAPPAAPPAAIPVAQSLPIRQRTPRQTSATRPAVVPVARPGTNRPAAPPRPYRPIQETRRRRSGGAGCSMFLLIVVILVFGFIILGLFLGHNGSGFGG